MMIGRDDRGWIWIGFLFQKLQDSEKLIKSNSKFETCDFVDSFPASSFIKIFSFKQSYFVEPEINKHIGSGLISIQAIHHCVGTLFQPAHQLAFLS